MDIVSYVEEQKKALKELVENFKARNGNTPSLTIYHDNTDERSAAYVRSKLRMAEELGITVRVTDNPDFLLWDNPKEATMIQSPSTLSFNHVPADYDVDGLSDEQKKRLAVGDWDRIFFPCTAAGIAQHIIDTNQDYEGKVALVIGRSDLVGKPLCKILRDRINMTVISAHSKTPKSTINALATQADFIVVAVGKKHWFNPFEPLKPTVKIYDVGINAEGGKLYGDVHPDIKSKYDSTPVPKGVGLLTVLALMTNTIICNERNENK